MIFKKNKLSEMIRFCEKTYNAFDGNMGVPSNMEIEGIKQVFISGHFDLLAFEKLHIDYFIPVAKESVIDMRNAIDSSKLKDNKFFTNEFVTNNLNEAICQAYVGLYHKHERLLNEFIKYAKSSNKDFLDLCKKYGFMIKFNRKKDLEDTRPESIKEIEWICNNHKHGFSSRSKNETPIKYMEIDKKIEITEKDLLAHIRFMKLYWVKMFQITLTIITVECFYEILDQVTEDKKPITLQAIQMWEEAIKNQVTPLIAL